MNQFSEAVGSVQLAAKPVFSTDRFIPCPLMADHCRLIFPDD